MALSNPRTVFGVHSFSPYNTTTGNFYGTVKVLDSSSLSLSGETIELTSGSSKYPWAVEDGLITAELSLKFSQYDDFLFEVFMGKAPTSNVAEATGSVTALAAKYGALIATTGLGSIAVKSGSHADLKFGKYIVKAVGATTVDVFLSSDVDITRGTDGTYQNDLLKVTASPLTITASTPVAIPNFGLEITGGSGTIGMTIGDTATFSVRPPNSLSTDVIIGGTNDVVSEFGAIIMAQARGNGELFEVDLFRCKGIGLPIGFSKKEWSTAEVTAKAFYDSTRNGVFSIRHVKPV